MTFAEKSMYPRAYCIYILSKIVDVKEMVKQEKYRNWL